MLEEHLGYLADRKRLDQYRLAIAKTVKLADVVTDLGCGSGVLGLSCLQNGASRAIAVDSTGIIEVARETFRRAGFLSRCELIYGHSYHVEPSVQADVVICDNVGYFGFDYGVIDFLKDARMRLLKPGGIIIPSRIRVWLGAVQSERVRKKVDGWCEQVPPEFQWLVNHTTNTKYPIKLYANEILGNPCELGIIDLRADCPNFFSWKAEIVAQRDGFLHGLAGWFECELAEHVWMTNSPLADNAIDRSQAYLPIAEGTVVSKGETINVTVLARPTENLIAWTVDLPKSGRRFSHSTWYGEILDVAELKRSDPRRSPHLSRTGRARSIVLPYCDGRRTASEIEQLVLSEHGDLFPSRAEISRFVEHALARDTD